MRGGAWLFLSNAVDSGIRVCASFPFGFFDNFQNLSPDLLLKIISFGSLSLSVSLLYPFVFRFEEFRRRFWFQTMRFLRLDSSQFLAYHPCKSLWFCCKRNESLTPHLHWSDNCQRHRQLLRNFSSPCDYLIVSFFRWIPLIKKLFAAALVLSGRGGLELLFGSKKKHQVDVSPSNGHIEVFFFCCVESCDLLHKIRVKWIL